MPNGTLHRQNITRKIAAIIDGYFNVVHDEHEIEDLSDSSVLILQKKHERINEQLIFLHAENRLLCNYLKWYEKKLVSNRDQSQRDSQQNRFSNELKLFPNQTSKQKIKQPLSIQKKRAIAEVTFKVLLDYSQHSTQYTTQYLEEYINMLETHDETIADLELELISLNKFNDRRRLSAKEFFDFIHDRIYYRDTLNARKHQQSIRLRFQISNIEKSIRKIRQSVDAITEVDFEQLKIEIEKQLKELNAKNKMLMLFKRQQSEANMKLNEKKPDLVKEIHSLTSIRHTITNTDQQLGYYNTIMQKLQDEISQYETQNDPLREMMLTYRVPSIHDYVDLKSRQMNLHRQIHAWQRKVQIAERELNLRRIESQRYPENIIHPWKYLENPSSILFNQHFKVSDHERNQHIDPHATTGKNKLSTSLPKLVKTF